jgi:hypothetical protein
MINDFLATLDNNPIDPGDILWPEFTAAPVSPELAALRAVFLGNQRRRRVNFLRAVQLTNLVANSPFGEVITARDPRVTYTPAGLASLFRGRGFIVQAFGPQPTARLVLGTTPNTPEAGEWAIRVVSVGVGTADLGIRDDAGNDEVVTVPFTPGGASASVRLPENAGVLTLFDTILNPTNNWRVVYQGAGRPWIEEVLSRVEGLKPNPAGLISPRLLRAWRVAPLALDRIAAVVAGLGGGQ